ncbi:MAG: mercury methylation ferredoxin HgcB [bacterium]|nr:mercury methylation ferredoxin HgcB [bacterium]
MEEQKYLKNVVTLEFYFIKCTGCGMCETVCPHSVFEVKEGKAHITERDLCMECGACAKNCPTEAIRVKAGVGCAGAIIMGALTGKEPTCGHSDDSKKSCCG